MNREAGVRDLFSDLVMVVVAGGAGQRFGGNKLLTEIAGVPLIVHTLRNFAPVIPSGRLALVVPSDAAAAFAAALSTHLPDFHPRWAHGGACRSASVRAGLDVLPSDATLVAVHDAARPLADAALLAKLCREACAHGAAIPAKRVTDTLKRCTADGRIIETVERTGLWRVETPQVFHLAELRAAYRKAGESAFADDEAIYAAFTDDAAVYAAAGYSCNTVHNPAPNPKLTFAGDCDEIARLLTLNKSAKLRDHRPGPS